MLLILSHLAAVDHRKVSKRVLSLSCGFRYVVEKCIRIELILLHGSSQSLSERICGIRLLDLLLIVILRLLLEMNGLLYGKSLLLMHHRCWLLAILLLLLIGVRWWLLIRILHKGVCRFLLIRPGFS